MDPSNPASSSSAPPVANDLPEKRKRGRPRKDQTIFQTQPDANLVGQTVYGEVKESIDEGTGYIVNVKVKDSDTYLKGVVLVKGKVTPVTPENDVAPHVKMLTRGENHAGHLQIDQTPNDQTPNDQPMEHGVSRET